MTSFTDLGVPQRIVEALSTRGITAPFPIQAATIEDALAGRDLSGRAPTGSGKTLAFSIPLAMRSGKGAPRKPRALVLVPTRELAAQVCEELRPLAKQTGRSVATFYGGTSISADRNRLDRGVDILVGCPGRIADLIQRRFLDLSDVDLAVIDEADRMADMGFLPEVRRLLDATREHRQTLLFSATLDGDVDVLVRRYQRNPVRHELEAAAEAAGDVNHLFWQTDQQARANVTADILKRVKPAIVFTRTKHGADRLAKRLNGSGLSAAAIHGNRSQNQRTRALKAFSEGHVTALIATDVAARGIHVDEVGVVVHYDLAGTDKDYVHRSGRTGRAGARGTVISLVTPDKVKDAKKMQRDLSMPSGFDTVDVGTLGDVLPASERPAVPAEPARGGQHPPGGRNGSRPGRNNPRSGGNGRGAGSRRGGNRSRASAGRSR